MRQGLVGELGGQFDPDQPGAPPRMRPPQRQRGRIQRTGQARATPPTAAVGGEQALLATVAVAPPEGAHRPRRKVQLLRDGGQGDAGQMALHDGLSQHNR